MNAIFIFLIAFSILIGIFNNTLQNVTNAMLDACNLSVKIAFSLIGIMAFWLGIMRIAEKSGFVTMISKIIYPLTKKIFKDIDRNSHVLGDITMSISANALGLTNAATPIGLKVMKELQENNKTKDIATDNMCLFLAMNTAGFQIIPATVIAILVGVGNTKPTEIILPTFIVTTLTFFTSIIIAIILRKIWNRKGFV